MAKVFTLPELGENIKAGDVVKVTVKAGDSVKKDQIVLELETDKAVVEVPSSVEGTVTKVHVKAGEKAQIGQTILTFSGEESSEKPAEKKVFSNAAMQPKMEPVKKADLKLAPQSPKIQTDGFAEKSQAPAKVIPLMEPAKSGSTVDATHVLSSPSVRKLAREIGIDIGQVAGSGKNDRVTEEDVKRHARKINTEHKPETPTTVMAPRILLPDFAKWGEVERKAMTGVRRKTAETMTLAWSTIPSVTQHDEADITELENLRKQFGERVRAHGGSLTMTVILIKIIASALKVFPQFNASIDMDAQEIIYKKFFHIGVAVDTERGLLVPVIRDVDKKNILKLSIEVGQIAERARNKQTSLEELQGAGFTITNLGGIGGGHFTPIINPPEVAILGVGRYQVKPLLNGKDWQPRKILPLSLTYDHRIIDGADAARFLRWVAEAMNQPFLMDLEG